MSAEIIINGIKAQLEKKQTILDVCRNSGISLLTLCHLKNKKQHAACGVCMVQDETTGRFLTACNTPAEKDMRILTETQELLKIRKKALELLLLEHLGDCYAPCQRSCPYDLPVMEMMTEYESKKISGDMQLLNPGDFCRDCSAPCEKACRRNVQEKASENGKSAGVACRTRILELYGTGSEKETDTPRTKQLSPSRIGKISEKNYALYLRRSAAVPGSGDCLKCGCHAVDSCKLLDLCRQFGINGRQSGVCAEDESFIRKSWGGLLYDPGKCLRCGRCLTAAEEDAPRPSFIRRGSRMEITLTGTEVSGEQARILTGLCPTGALSAGENG